MPTGCPDPRGDGFTKASQCFAGAGLNRFSSAASLGLGRKPSKRPGSLWPPLSKTFTGLAEERSSPPEQNPTAARNVQKMVRKFRFVRPMASLLASNPGFPYRTRKQLEYTRGFPVGLPTSSVYAPPGGCQAPHHPHHLCVSALGLAINGGSCPPGRITGGVGGHFVLRVAAGSAAKHGCQDEEMHDGFIRGARPRATGRRITSRRRHAGAIECKGNVAASPRNLAVLPLQRLGVPAAAGDR